MEYASMELREEAQNRDGNLEIQNVWSPLLPPKGMMSDPWEAGKGDLTSTSTQTGNDLKFPSLPKDTRSAPARKIQILPH